MKIDKVMSAIVMMALLSTPVIGQQFTNHDRPEEVVVPMKSGMLRDVQAALNAPIPESVNRPYRKLGYNVKVLKGALVSPGGTFEETEGTGFGFVRCFENETNKNQIYILIFVSGRLNEVKRPDADSWQKYWNGLTKEDHEVFKRMGIVD